MANLDWHAARSDLPGLALLDRAPESEGIDLAALRLCRQDRVRAQMRHYGVDAVILSDPVNIREATGARNMQVFGQRTAPARYLLLTADRSVLFEFTGCPHLGQGVETIDEVRPARTASFVAASLRATEAGVERLRAAIRPGLTEAELWSRFPFEEDLLRKAVPGAQSVTRVRRGHPPSPRSAAARGDCPGADAGSPHHPRRRADCLARPDERAGGHAGAAPDPRGRRAHDHRRPAHAGYGAPLLRPRDRDARWADRL